MLAIEKEIEKLWVSKTSKYDIRPPDGLLFGKVIAESDIECNKRGERNLRPWLQIFEQGIQWLGALSASLIEAEKNKRTIRDDRAPIALIGSACIYSVAIRRLVLSGLDSPARIILRSLSETLSMCLALLAKKNLSDEFKKAQSFEDAKRLWFKKLSGTQLESILAEIETSLGADAKLQSDLRRLRQNQSAWLSQYVHNAYLAAELSFFPASIAHPGMHKPGILGLSSPSSIVTLDAANKLIWYFGKIAHLVLFGKYLGGPFYRIDPESEIDNIAFFGREVFSDLVRRHWNDADKRLKKRKKYLNILDI